MNAFLNKGILVLIAVIFLLASSCSRSHSDKKLSLPKGWYLSLNNTKVTPFKLKNDSLSHRLQIDRQNNSKDSVYFIRGGLVSLNYIQEKNENIH